MYLEKLSTLESLLGSKNIFSTNDVANVFGVTSSTVCSWIKTDKFKVKNRWPASRIKFIITRDELKTYILENNYQKYILDKNISFKCSELAELIGLDRKFLNSQTRQDKLKCMRTPLTTNFYSYDDIMNYMAYLQTYSTIPNIHVMIQKVKDSYYSKLEKKCRLDSFNKLPVNNEATFNKLPVKIEDKSKEDSIVIANKDIKYNIYQAAIRLGVTIEKAIKYMLDDLLASKLVRCNPYAVLEYSTTEDAILEFEAKNKSLLEEGIKERELLNNKEILTLSEVSNITYLSEKLLRSLISDGSIKGSFNNNVSMDEILKFMETKEYSDSIQKYVPGFYTVLYNKYECLVDKREFINKVSCEEVTLNNYDTVEKSIEDLEKISEDNLKIDGDYLKNESETDEDYLKNESETDEDYLKNESETDEDLEYNTLEEIHEMELQPFNNEDDKMAKEPEIYEGVRDLNLKIFNQLSKSIECEINNSLNVGIQADILKLLNNLEHNFLKIVS